MPNTPKIVVFDLGGVLARICHTWEEAITVAQVRSEFDLSGATDLGAYSGFEPYQADAIDSSTYLAGLADFVGCSPEDAIRVHNGIIRSEYDGLSFIVDAIEALGIETGCLSNTNPEHWEHLALDGSFPTIHRLKHKMASHIVRKSKPDVAFFRGFEETFGFKPEEIVYFEDMPRNVEGALRASWRAHRIDPSLETAPQIRAFLVEEGVFPTDDFA